MQALLAHYNVRRQLTVTLASAYVAAKLVYTTARPYAIKGWQLATSERAQRCYEFLILSVLAIVAVTCLAGFWLGCRTREQFDRCLIWRDRFIASHLEQPSEFLTASELAEEGHAELVSDAIAVQGVSKLADLFAQADAIMSSPIYADAPATPVKRRHKPKAFQSTQEVIA